MTLAPITLTAHGTVELTAGTDRALTGQIVSFDRPTDDNRGLIIKSGSLTPRMPLKRTKLLRDHDHSDPVGYMVEISDDRLRAKFFLPEGENSDRALTEARNGLRDGLSIGFTVTEYHIDEDDNIVVTAAVIHEVSLCALPAFADAGISASAVFALTPERILMSNPTPTAPPVAPAAPEAPAGQLAAATGAAAPVAAAQPAPVELALPGTPVPVPAAAPAIHTQPRPVSLRQIVNEVATALQRNDRAAVRLALQDVLPADDAGNGLLRDDWRGELWQADNSRRPMIEALGVAKELRTGSKIKGWAWDVKPDVQTYTGNKTNVPSNKPKTKAVEASVHRSAGGWDIDRIFIDLGEPGFLESFWAAAVADYKLDSETYCAATFLAGSFALPAAPTLLQGLGKLGSSFAAIGAQLDAIFIAPDLFEEYAQLTQAEVPFWLANATGLSLRDQKATVGDLHIETHPSLADGQISAFDSRAADWFEKTPPIRVNAIDLPKGGIDLGLFGYDGLLINDPRAAVKMQIGTAPAPDPEG